MVVIRDVMKKRVITVTANKTLADAAKIMTNNRVGSLVVVKNNDVPIDMVTESDMVTLIAKGFDPRKVKIGDMKKRKIKKRSGLVVVKPTDNILDVTRLMVRNGVKRVPVVEKGRLEGIVADKEVLLISPELIEIMSEKMKARCMDVAEPGQTISGICENCGGYSDFLEQDVGSWTCKECRA